MSSRLRCTLACQGAGRRAVQTGKERGQPYLFRGVCPSSAFTLVEILVVMALLSMIVLGLMAMFNQTQRAFRAGLMQTDVLESGRLATDLLAREMEWVTPSYYPSNFLAGGINYKVPNFRTDLACYSYQTLPSAAGGTWRTNLLDDVFFLTHENKTWTGIGYFARTNRLLGNGSGLVCTLYRYEESLSDAQFNANRGGLYVGYNSARGRTNAMDNVSKIMDGVVHFRIQPADAAGWMIPFNTAWRWYTNLPSAVLETNLLYGDFNNRTSEYERYEFYSNVVPAFVEFEVGVLEQQTLERYKSLPTPVTQTNFFVNQAGRVHLFRQRVAVRNVDPLAYQ